MFTGPIRRVNNLVLVVVSSVGVSYGLDLFNRPVLHHGLEVGIDANKVLLAVLRLIFVIASGVAVSIDVVCYIFTRSREHAQELAHSLILVFDVSSITVVVSKRRRVPHKIRLIQLPLLLGDLVSTTSIKHSGSVKVIGFLVVRNIIKTSTTIV